MPYSLAFSILFRNVLLKGALFDQIVYLLSLGLKGHRVCWNLSSSINLRSVPRAITTLFILLTSNFIMDSRFSDRPSGWMQLFYFRNRHSAKLVLVIRPIDYGIFLYRVTNPKRLTSRIIVHHLGAFLLVKCVNRAVILIVQINMCKPLQRCSRFEFAIQDFVLVVFLPDCSDKVTTEP